MKSWKFRAIKYDKTKNLFMVNDTLLGATKKDIMLVTIIGIFLLVGGSTASYIAIQGFDDELTKKMIADYHGIIVLGAGGGLVVLGITVREKLTR